MLWRLHYVPSQLTYAVCRLAEELFVLNKAALLDRKERMRLHLQQDSLRIQRELAAQGLGVVPTLD